MKILLRNILKDMAVYLVLCAATFLMLKLLIEYTAMRDNVGFLKVKQDYLHIKVWKAAFYTHVFSSIFTLLASFTQFSDYILKHHRKWHRVIGRIYAIDILLINFPAGMIMAVYANGLLPTKIAFVILDSLWFYFTYKAVVEIRKRNITTHRQYMIRSYALTFSAITLRTWKLILSSTLIIEPLTLYMIDAWLGFVPNLLLAEWLIRRKKKATKTSSLNPDIVNQQQEYTVGNYQ